jgi:hypothetical protein
MPSDGTIGGLIGKLDVLRFECPTCGRQDRYQAARLLEELGPAARLTDWLIERTADCPQKDPAGPHAGMRRGHAGFGGFALSWLPPGEPGRRAVPLATRRRN